MLPILHSYDPHLNMDPTIEWNSVKFELKKDWLKGEFSCRSKPVDGRMPREANFFLIFYKDTDIALPHPYKAYTIDQGAAERCCSSDFTHVVNIEAYQIPEIPEIEGSESDYQKMMRKCKEPRFHGALGVWEEEHKMSNHYEYLSCWPMPRLTRYPGLTEVKYTIC